MEQQKRCSAEIRAGHQSPRRAVVFLRHPGAGYANVAEEFERASTTVQRYFNTSFDYWVDEHIKKKRYHGWDQSQYGGKYKDCFVFKCSERNAEHRLYGFLFHPKAPEDSRFQVCVLALHARKNEWRTDETELKRVRELSEREEVTRVIKELFSKPK
jgi:hypothetical protein